MGQQVLTEAQTLPLSGKIRAIEVAIGEVLVIPPYVEEPDEDARPLALQVVEAGDTLDCQDAAGISLYAPRSASVNIVETETARQAVADAAVAEHDAERLARPVDEPTGTTERKSKRRASRKAASRGDAGGGNDGGFESRTVKQLTSLAKRRKIDVPYKGSKPTKAELVKALRSE